MLVTALLLSTQAAAETGPLRQQCPVRLQGEAELEFLIRTRPSCEQKYEDLVKAGNTPGDTHENYLKKRCTLECGAPRSGNTALIAGGVAVAAGAGIAVAASSSHSHERPASP